MHSRLKYQLHFNENILKPLVDKIDKIVCISDEAVNDSELPSNFGKLTDIYFEEIGASGDHLQDFNSYASITMTNGSVYTINTHEIVESPIKIEDVEHLLKQIWISIGIDVPINHNEILQFIVNDIIATADNNDWHSGDVAIAFRRWIEKDCEV